MAKAGGEGKDDAATESKKEVETGDAESGEKGDKSEAVKEDGAGKEEDVKEDGAEKEEDVKGIPSFWLTAMRNAEVLEAMVKVRQPPR